MFDGVFCLADEADACDAHAHPPDISWRIERLVPDPGLGHEERRLAGWHDAVSTAARRGYRHLLLLDESAPACVAVPRLEDREWHLCLLPTRAGVPALDADGSRAPAGLAMAVHERAYKQLLSDLPAEEAGRTEFLAAWGSVDSYIVQHIADGTFTALQALTAGPDTDQPQRAVGIDVTDLAGGLMVHPAGSPMAHQLNNTASVIFELCDGHRTVTGIAEKMAVAFGLDAVPLAEVTACVAGLRSTGILADPIYYPAQARVVAAASIQHTAESRTP